MRDPILRLAEARDLPGLLALYRHLNPEDPPLEPGLAETAWAALLAAPQTRVHLAEMAGRLAASCTLTLIPNLTRGARSYALIENVVTLPEHRRQGLGQAVLHRAVETAWQAGCYKVMLATGSPLDSTLRFYERAGFRRGKTAFEQRRP